MYIGSSGGKKERWERFLLGYNLKTKGKKLKWWIKKHKVKNYYIMYHSVPASSIMKKDFHFWKREEMSPSLGHEADVVPASAWQSHTALCPTLIHKTWCSNCVIQLTKPCLHNSPCSTSSKKRSEDFVKNLALGTKKKWKGPMLKLILISKC